MRGRLSLALVVASILVGGDEINIIEPGHNYGWGVATMGVQNGITKRSEQGMDDPVVANGSLPVGDPVVDSWPVGPDLDCAADGRCPALLATARIGFDLRNPGHPAVVRVVLHQEGTTVNAKGEHILVTRSGACCVVARFELADGSVAAIGVGYPGVSKIPIAIDKGP